MSSQVVELDIAGLVKTAGTQMRPSLNPDRVEELAELFTDGMDVDPIDVMRTEVGDVVWDGFHRCEAAFGTGRTTIRARLASGTLRDAVILACGANAIGPLPRTVETKRRAVMALLEQEEYRDASHREIARIARVSHEFVRQVRKELEALATPPPVPEPIYEPVQSRIPSSNGTARHVADDDDIEDDEPADAYADEERAAIREMAKEEEQRDAAKRWLDSLPARAHLTPDRRRIFDHEATNYKTVSDNPDVQKGDRQKKRVLDEQSLGIKGPFHERLLQSISIPHPRDWKACLDCGGSGDNGNCRKCRGHGYKIV